MQNEGIIAKGIKRLANAITSLTTRVENAKGMVLEHITIILYCTAHVLMYLIHEPWFDEALAWLIARDSSIYEILFVTPHYEGHPALWHLILVPFAKLGAPYELSLNLVSLVFSGLAVGLFIYKAPFKRIIRLTMPFTYYLFYQYGVISRPYCMMMLAFVIMALTFKNRNEKPGRFVLSLWFLCVSSAYGIVIAGGICIAWLTEMFIMAGKKSKENNTDNGEYRGTLRIFIKGNLFVQGKFFWLLGLLVYVLFILWRIIPDSNAYAVVRSTKAIADNGFIVRLLYTVFASLSDLFVTNVFYTSGTLENADIYMGEMIVAVLIGIAIIIMVIIAGRKMAGHNGKMQVFLCYFIIPYIMFSVFAAYVYLYYHHIGIILLFIGFWAWIIKQNSEKSDVGITKENQAVSKNDSIFIKNYMTKQLAKSSLVLISTLMIIIPLYWTVSSTIMDVFRSYGSGRGEYEYLSEHELDGDYIIFADWRRIFKDEEVPMDYTKFDPLLSQPGINIEPYLQKAQVVNSPKLIGKSYTYEHVIPDKVETEQIVKMIMEKGAPDIILGRPEFEELSMQGYVDYNDYILVYKDIFGNVKKGYITERDTYIYVRKELAEEKGLKSISK